MKSLLQRRIVTLVRALLVQGLTPQKIALSLACGVVCSLFPVMGTTTALCAAVAVALRLNLPAIQAVNLLLYPAQLVLIVPFIRAGEFLLRSSQTKLTLAQMIAMTRGGAGQAFHLLWRLAVEGIAAWLLFAPLALLLLYWIFLGATTRVAEKLPSRRAASAV